MTQKYNIQKPVLTCTYNLSLLSLSFSGATIGIWNHGWCFTTVPFMIRIPRSVLDETGNYLDSQFVSPVWT